MQNKITKLSLMAIIGVLFVVVGSVLLLKTTGNLRDIEIIWPIIGLLIGLFCLYFVVFQRMPPRYVIFGVFFTLSGIVYLLLMTVFEKVELNQVWPIFMCIVGISITVYGYLKKGMARTMFLVPGYTLIVLSLIFLAFSLQLIEGSLLTFVVVWWPLFLIVLGIDMIVAFFIRRRQKKERNG